MAEKQNKPTGRMDELLLERDRLDQVIKNCFSRDMTILFSDICGFTQYTDKKGDLPESGHAFETQSDCFAGHRAP